MRNRNPSLEYINNDVGYDMVDFWKIQFFLVISGVAIVPPVTYVQHLMQKNTDPFTFVTV